MKLKEKQIDTFFNNPPINGGIVFLYGPDYGLSAQRSKYVIDKLNLNPTDPFSSSILSFDEIEKRPYTIVETALTIPMLKVSRLVKINLINEIKTSNFNKAIKLLVDKLPIEDCWVIVEAGEIKSSSSLITLLTHSKYSVLIGCFNDDNITLKKLVTDIFNDHNIQYSNLDFNLLTSLLGNDRLNTINELDKLISYIFPNKFITNNDVLDCLVDSSVIEIDKISFSVMLGNKFDCLNKIDSAVLSGIETIFILKRTQYWFKLLLDASFIRDNKNANGKFHNDLFSNVFWKNKPYLNNALKLWKSKNIQKVIDILLELEEKLKLFPANSTTLLSQSYLSIASWSKRD